MTENDLLEFIRQAHPITPLRPANFGLTILEYAHAENVGGDSARTFLDSLVEGGVLEKRAMRTGKARAYVYARPGDWANVV